MIPIAILAGIIVGRRWAIPVVAVVWGAVLAVTQGGTSVRVFVAGSVLAAINAAVGVAVRHGLKTIAGKSIGGEAAKP